MTAVPQQKQIMAAQKTRIGTAFGIPLYLHWSFLLIPGYVLVSGLMMGRPPFGIAADLLLVAAIFTCVVLHELGHALSARRFGVETRDIILLPIGGVARLERIPRRPLHEFLVAIAGPAVNVVLAAVLLAIALPLVGVNGLTEPSSFTANFTGKVIAVNIAMVVFNLVPAFPMDGGRILRSALAARFGFLQATRWAATVGRVLAVVLGLAGLFVLNNPILMLIALFVFFGAGQEANMAETESALRGLRVRDVMVTQFETIPSSATAQSAVRTAMSARRHELPVVAGRTFVGLLQLSDAVAAVQAGDGDVPAGDICRSDLPTIHVNSEMVQAIQAAQGVSAKLTVLPVVDDFEQIIGLLTPESFAAASRYGDLIRTLSASPLRQRPDDHSPGLTRMQIG
jgi:Zn-dependent protease